MTLPTAARAVRDAGIHPHLWHRMASYAWWQAHGDRTSWYVVGHYPEYDALRDAAAAHVAAGGDRRSWTAAITAAWADAG
jgi:hypothetical protein